jgi:hypothetical protein
MNETSKNQITEQQQAELLKAINPEKVIKESQAKLQDAILEDLSNQRAAREPLPQNTSNFFSSKDPLVVKISTGEEITIRSAVIADIDIFKITKSPFYEKMMDNSESAFFTDEEEKYALVYQFTTPVKEVYKSLKKGKEAFTDIVMDATGFKYLPFDFELILSKTMEHLFGVLMTKLNFEAPPEPESKSADNNETTLVDKDGKPVVADDKKKLTLINDASQIAPQVLVG